MTNFSPPYFRVAQKKSYEMMKKQLQGNEKLGINVYIGITSILNAPVAQLDRAPDYESGG